MPVTIFVNQCTVQHSITIQAYIVEIPLLLQTLVFMSLSAPFKTKIQWLWSLNNGHQILQAISAWPCGAMVTGIGFLSVHLKNLSLTLGSLGLH